MRPSASQLERLRALRFVPNNAQPSLGPGERRSRMRGVGLEFMDHRAYRAGDDVRNLDARLMARLGQPFIRQFAADQKLPVTLLIDASASMRAGTGDKLAKATELAHMLGFLSLCAGDAVQVCRLGGADADQSPQLTGAQRADMLFAWLGRDMPVAEGSFSDAVARVLPMLPAKGLVIVLSDWLDRDAEMVLAMLGQRGHEPIAVQIALPEEIDPRALGKGGVTLADSETGATLAVSLDEGVLERYARAFDAYKDRLRQGALRVRGSYYFLATTDGAGSMIDAARKDGLIA